MNTLSKFLASSSVPTTLLLDASIPMENYTPIDLSSSNPRLKNINIINPQACQDYIDEVLNRNSAQVAYGGYLEKRNLYADKASFSGEMVRNIHLGMDFWASAGTIVNVPLDATIHSFSNNATIGDYGPTIILKHEIGNKTFHTLYGHLSLASLDGLSIGKVLRKGDALGTLGTTDINVNYAPHVHFQLINDIEEKKGDYPGVCSAIDLDFYSKNCPDPNLILNIPN